MIFEKQNSNVSGSFPPGTRPTYSQNLKIKLVLSLIDRVIAGSWLFR